MSKGTSELQKLLQEAAAREAQEEEAARAAQEEAARAATAKPARVRRTSKKATRPEVESENAPVAAAVAPPVASPVPPLPPLIDLDAIDDEYAESNAADRPPHWVPPAAPPPLPPPAPPPPGTRGRRGVMTGVVIAGLTVAGAGIGLVLATIGGGASAATFIKQADAVCAPANAPVTAITKPTSYPELATASGTVVTTTRGQVAQLNGLKFPGGATGAAAAAVVTALDATAQAAERLQNAAGARDDAATIAGTHALGAAFNDAKAKAATFGFTACAAGMQSGIDNLYAGSSGIIKTAFVAKADTLCRATAREMARIPEPRNTSGREIARYMDRGLVLAEKLLVDLKALPVPPGDEATVAEMWAIQDTLGAKFREMQAAAAVEDGSRVLAIDKETTPLVTAGDAKLDAYGLGSCGSSFGEY